MKGVCGREVRLLRCSAGWYIGTTDEMVGPYCHDSVEYYRTRAEAELALMRRGCFGTPQDEDEDEDEDEYFVTDEDEDEDDEEEYFVTDLDMGFDPYMGCYSDDC